MLIGIAFPCEDPVFRSIERNEMDSTAFTRNSSDSGEDFALTAVKTIGARDCDF